MCLNWNPRTSRRPTFGDITSKNTFLIFVVDSSNIRSNRLLLIEKIHELQVNIKIGIFFANTISTTSIIENLFRFSCSKRIFNIFIAFYLRDQNNGTSSEPLLNILKYNPFGKFHVINATKRMSPEDLFPEKVPNFQRNPIRFCKLKDHYTYLHSFLFWQTVVEKFNAVMSLTKSNRGMYMADEAKYDILPYETIKPYNYFTIYPHKTAHIVMIVPHAPPITGYVAILKNITSENLFCYTFIVISVVFLALVASRYMSESRISFFASAADVLSLLMNDNATIKYQQLRAAEAWIVLPLTFVGLVVVNGILSILLSHAALPLYHNQIKTFDDLYQSSVPVLNDGSSSEVYIERLEALSPHGGWRKKVHDLDIDEMNEDSFTFNNTVAFIILYEEGELLLELHQRLNLESFHMISKPYLLKYFYAYSSSKKFVYNEYLNALLHYFQSAGLIERWYEMKQRDAMRHLLRVHANRKYTSVDDSELGIPAVVWCGWIASLVVFICEIIWQKTKLQEIAEKRRGKSFWLNRGNGKVKLQRLERGKKN